MLVTRAYTSVRLEAISVVLVCIESFGSQNTVADQNRAPLAHTDACLINDKRFSEKRRIIGYDRKDAAS